MLNNGKYRIPTDEELDNLLEIESRASPGPWEFKPGHSTDGDSIDILKVELGVNVPEEDSEYAMVFDSGLLGDDVASANWDLCRAARNDLPTLIAEIKWLRRQYDLLADYIQHYNFCRAIDGGECSCGLNTERLRLFRVSHF